MKTKQYITILFISIFNWGFSQYWNKATSFNNPNGAVYAIENYNNQLIVAGDFNQCGGLVVSNIAQWNGTNWSTLGVGLPSTVKVLHVYNGILYAGTIYDGLLKWNGSGWSPTGIQGHVSDLEVLNNQLVVGGYNCSLTIDGNNYGCVFIGNGSTWNILSNNGGGNEMTVFNNELYSNGVGNGIGKWNGAGWSDVAGMVASTPIINSMEVYNGKLFVAGEFNSLGGITLDDVAAFDGTTWSNLFWSYGEAHRLKSIMGNLYATTWIGNFNSALSIYERVLKWTGSGWQGIGENQIQTSESPYIAAINEYESSIYVGGSLLIDIGLPTQASNLIKLENGANLSTDDFEEDVIQVFPNPATDYFFCYGLVEYAEINIRSLDGKTSLICFGSENQAIDIRSLFPGTYIVEVISKDRIFTSRFVKLN